MSNINAKLTALKETLQARQDPARVRYTARLVEAKEDAKQHQVARVEMSDTIAMRDEDSRRVHGVFIMAMLISAALIAVASWWAWPCGIAIGLLGYACIFARRDASAARLALKRHGGDYRLGGE